MTGRAVDLEGRHDPGTPAEPVLRVEGLMSGPPTGQPRVDDVSLTVRAGEIVGIAGVAGNGQSELWRRSPGCGGRARAGSSSRETDARRSPRRRCRDAGIAYIPEDRQRQGLILDFTLAENLGLREYRRAPASRFGWLRPSVLARRARDLLAEFDVRGGGTTTLASALSGGNQQKVIVAREVANDPRLLVASQPTRGLDVGATEFVHNRLVRERDEGRAVLLVSFAIEEIQSLSDRILVLYEGQIVGEYPPTVSKEELGIAMTGGRSSLREGTDWLLKVPA